MKTYLRAIALLHGPDALAQISTGTAASLAGRRDLAFTQAEWIEREGKTITRRILTLDEARSHPTFSAITQPRANFGPLALNRIHVMGVVNVTPDSFSDGGVNSQSGVAITAARQMIEDGASLLDIGGESTRPGAVDVSIIEEQARIMPVIMALAQNHLVSVDTRKSGLMREALGAGAAFINDVSALQYDPASA
ncbi:MAG TPA: dihydropteroate synthase, partial [Aestuariivirga sp.]